MARMRSLAIPLLCVVAFAADVDRTPPQIYTLEIDGTRHEIVGGRTHELEIHGNKTSVRLTPRPYHEAETKWFSFRFPRGYKFEYDDGKDSGTPPDWTLDGEACFISLTAKGNTEPAVDALGICPPGPARLAEDPSLGMGPQSGVHADGFQSAEEGAGWKCDLAYARLLVRPPDGQPRSVYTLQRQAAVWLSLRRWRGGAG